ncbi:heme-degrading monooxygenase IsdG [Listeria monocytogenes]|nr:heme-degrading monooxygenase IsdG [Listeria monocytogenes]
MNHFKTSDCISYDAFAVFSLFSSVFCSAVCFFEGIAFHPIALGFFAFPFACYDYFFIVFVFWFAVP